MPEQSHLRASDAPEIPDRMMKAPDRVAQLHRRVSVLR